jgi:hypothetical protein
MVRLTRPACREYGPADLTLRPWSILVVTAGDYGSTTLDECDARGPARAPYPTQIGAAGKRHACDASAIPSHPPCARGAGMVIQCSDEPPLEVQDLHAVRHPGRPPHADGRIECEGIWENFQGAVFFARWNG